MNENGEVPLAVNLHWGFKAVAAEISALTGLPAKAANDANVAALGEAWKGAAEGAKSVVLLTLGTGVGGGIIVDGKIVPGFHGAGGEVGHANMNSEEAESCNCGNHGCLEQYASATGIVRVAKRVLDSTQAPSVLRKNMDKLSAKQVLDAYKDGDVLAVQIMEKSRRYTGQGAWYFLLCDRSTDHRDRRRSFQGRTAADRLYPEILQEVCVPTCKDTPIVLATLGN